MGIARSIVSRSLGARAFDAENRYLLARYRQVVFLLGAGAIATLGVVEWYEGILTPPMLAARLVWIGSLLAHAAYGTKASPQALTWMNVAAAAVSTLCLAVLVYETGGSESPYWPILYSMALLFAILLPDDIFACGTAVAVNLLSGLFILDLQGAGAQEEDHLPVACH